MELEDINKLLNNQIEINNDLTKQNLSIKEQYEEKKKSLLLNKYEIEIFHDKNYSLENKIVQLTNELDSFQKQNIILQENTLRSMKI